MRFSALFNRLLKGSVAVEVYRRKENSEDGETQGEFYGVYSYGGRVPREIWSSYVARIWPLDSKTICVIIEDWKDERKN
ncbi:hypothetical protein LI072_12150 [bacterium 210928-DFI.3.100]|nr:hypothetical protein [bacterium 210928-DFI.3.100]